ncbi:MAG: PilN domain-containing protein [Dehalococcoidia bacterium]
MARPGRSWASVPTSIRKAGSVLARQAFRAARSTWRRMNRLVCRLVGRTTVTLAVDGDTVRVVIFKGGEVVRWGTVRLGEGPHTVRSLLREMGVRKGRIVSDMPLGTALTRVMALPKVPARHLAQIVQTEAQEAFPFRLGEMDLAWRPVGNGTGESILAAVASREALDSHMHRLQKAGVHPKALYPKEVALAALVGQGLVVYLGEQDTAIVPVVGWMPKVVYRLPLPGDGFDSHREAILIADAVKQAQAYVRGNSGCKEGKPLPVVLVGNPERGAWLTPALQRLLKYPLQTLAVPAFHPADFPTAAYAVNLGLALAHRAVSANHLGRAGALVPNMLPARYRPRPFPLTSALAITALLALGVSALWVTGQVARVGEEKARLSSLVGEIQARHRLLRLTAAQAATLERQARGLEQQTSAVQSLLRTLRQEREALLARLEAITNTALEAGVQVSGVSLQSEVFSLAGTATTYEAAIRYATGLRLSGLFQDVRLLRMDASGSGGEQGMIAFQIKALVGTSQEHK